MEELGSFHFHLDTAWIEADNDADALNASSRMKCSRRGVAVIV